MLDNVRIELLQLAVRRYTPDVVADFLRVPRAELYGWLLGESTVPDPALVLLVDLLDPKQTRH